MLPRAARRRSAPDRGAEVVAVLRRPVDRVSGIEDQVARAREPGAAQLAVQRMHDAATRRHGRRFVGGADEEVVRAVAVEVGGGERAAEVLATLLDTVDAGRTLTPQLEAGAGESADGSGQDDDEPRAREA